MLYSIFLQTVPDVSFLNEYGVLGFFSGVLLIFLSVIIHVGWQMIKSQMQNLTQKCNDSEKKIDDLQKELRNYLEAEALASKEALKGATMAIERNSRVLERWEQKIP